MSNLNFNKSGFSKFVSSKGFYIALAVCLIGTGAAAWIAVDKTLGSLDGDGSSMDFSAEFSSSEVEQVGHNNESKIPSSSEQESSQQSAQQSQSEQSESQSQSSALQTQAQPQSVFYVLPVEGAEIINDYSNGELVKSKTMNDWRTHDGIDIKGNVGTQVRAVADGTVTKVYNDTLWGNTIILQHANGIESIYCSLSDQFNVKEGDAVKASDVIGAIGESAICEISEVPHLHFAMKQNGKWVSPLETMGNAKTDS